MAEIVIVSNTRCVVRGATRSELSLLDEKFSFEVPGFQFSQKFRMGMWDGRRHLFYKKGFSFPLGLLHRAKKLLPDTCVEDERIVVEPGPKPELVTAAMFGAASDFVVRDYQVSATQAWVKAQRGLLHIATNGGKTLCAAAAIKILPRRHAVLFVVHTKALLRQTKKALASYLGIIEDVIGEIGDGVCRIAHITVAIVNSLHKRMRSHASFRKWLANDVQCLILDEVHHARSSTWFDVAQACGAQFRLGLSGTPFASPDDRLLVEAAIGPVLARVTNDQLIKLGVSAKPTVEIISYEPTKIPADKHELWHDVYSEGVVQNAARNAVLVQTVKRYREAGKKVLILVDHVWHGDIISTLLRTFGLVHDFVHAKIPIDSIMATKDRFQEGDLGLLIASPVFGEGVDIPAIGVLINAGGGRSMKNVLQRVGRSLRRKEGENVVKVVDFADTSHPFLARHSSIRIRIYEREKFEVVAV